MADLEKLRLVAQALRQHGFDVSLQPKRGSIFVNPSDSEGLSFSFHQTAASGMWRGVRYGRRGSSWREIPVKVPAATTDITRIARAIIESMQREGESA
jgi:hypothetical protein